MNNYITVIGGGLAGCEAAYQIAKKGIEVHLYEMKPNNYSPAHTNEKLAEIVCSNSFKSNLLTNACGLLKEELRRLDSLLIHTADNCSVPAGQALAVDREQFSNEITDKLEAEKLIKIIRKEVKSKYDSTEKTKEEVKSKYDSTDETKTEVKSKNDNTAETKKENNLSTNYEEKVENTIYKEEKKNNAVSIDEKVVNNVYQEKVDNKTLEKDNIYLEDIIEQGIVIIATGPLTSNSLSVGIQHLINEKELHFYDAQAPIIEKNSIDFNIAFYGNRYEQEKKKDETIEEWKERIKNQDNSYINLPMNKEEYENFINELVNAEVVTLRDFEKKEIFEGCMPVEIMAKRGIDTLRFGPLKPVGFDDPRTGKRPYAIVQLRQDNNKATLYNIVGFQTNLKFGEQKRIFSMIPGLENAEFEKYGVMHRNTFINSPKLLDNTYNLKKKSNIFFAGQITGVEGYVESISSGLVAGINAVKLYENSLNIANMSETELKSDDTDETNNEKETGLKVHDKNQTELNLNNTSQKGKIEFPEETIIGALAKYISSSNDEFQPMNANFGIMPELEGSRIKDKKLRYQKIAERSLKNI